MAMLPIWPPGLPPPPPPPPVPMPMGSSVFYGAYIVCLHILSLFLSFVYPNPCEVFAINIYLQTTTCVFST